MAASEEILCLRLETKVKKSISFVNLISLCILLTCHKNAYETTCTYFVGHTNFHLSHQPLCQSLS